MADGTLRTNAYAPAKNGRADEGASKRATTDLEVQVDDGDLEMLQQGTLRILRVKAKTRLDATPGAYKELEVGGESLPIIDVTIDPKRGMGAIVTVR